MKKTAENTNISPELTGCSGEVEQHVHVPMSMDWISDDLLLKTINVWSKSYGHPISADDAVEILGNVKQFVEILMKHGKV